MPYRGSGKFRQRKSWFWARKKIRERYCSKCDRPYFDLPIPQEDEQLVCGSAVALIFSVRRWGKKSLVVQFGKSQSSGRALYLSQLFEQDDLRDLIEVVNAVQQYVAAPRGGERF